MRSFIFRILIMLIAVNVEASAQSADFNTAIFERHKKYDPKANAQKDIQDAISIAQKVNKKIILDVGGEWCPWCHRLDSLFKKNKDLDDFLFEHYIVVKINVSDANWNQEVLSKYPKIPGYPHIFLLNKYGELIYSQSTVDWEYPRIFFVKGYSKKRVFAFLKKWAE